MLKVLSGFKVCNRCNIEKSIDQFIPIRNKPSAHCRVCHNKATNIKWHQKTAEEKKALGQKKRLTKFSITEEGYRAIVDAFKGVCGICQSPPDPNRDFAIDHDHSCCTGNKSCGQCIRGILCLECNLRMSWVDKVGLDAVAAYIQGGLL